MKFVLSCLALVACVSCTTLENRRDLYSPDTEFYQWRPAKRATVQQTTTTTTTTIEKRATKADQEEAPALPRR